MQTTIHRTTVIVPPKLTQLTPPARFLSHNPLQKTNPLHFLQYLECFTGWSRYTIVTCIIISLDVRYSLTDILVKRITSFPSLPVLG